MKRCSVCVAALVGSLACVQRVSALSLTLVDEYTRPATPTGLSGVTYIGGDSYYTINDSDGEMYPATITVDRSSGKVSACTFGSAVVLSGGVDMEGIAYDPGSGCVWVSDETGATLKEYLPSMGNLTGRTAPVPAIQKNYVSNYSLESLTMRGNGLEMWTCNEETLTVDGPISTETSGCYVRLTKFTRPTVDSNWVNAGQWAYLTDAIGGTDYNNSYRSGVADLCSLPDGTLLVLEREMSCKSSFLGIGIPSFRTRIYQVNFSGATDVSSYSSLSNQTFTAVSKTKLLNKNMGTSMYEGICIGPRLNDGSLSILLMADGDGEAAETIYALKLSGLDAHTLNFTSPEGTAQPHGSNYRLATGSSFTATVTEPAITYSNWISCTGWKLPNHSPSSGTGTTCTFTVAADDTLTWQWTNTVATALPVCDSFENYPIGQVLDNIYGWTGSGIVSAETYTAATPPGFPITNAVHTKVLVSEDTAERAVNTTSGENVIVDFMTKPRRAAELLADFGTGVHCAIAEDTNGFLCIWHQMSTGATRWTRLQKHAIADGVWVRMSFTLDFNSGAYLMVQPRVNGSLCPTAYGFRGPEDLRSPGSWYICADQGSGNKKLSAVSMVGQGSMDDLVVADSALSFAHTGSTSTNNIPFVWFDSNGIARDPLDDLDGDGRTAAQEYIAGTDPNDATSFFQILRTWKEDGLAVVQFTGSNPLATYAMKVCTNLLLKDGWTTVTGDLSLVNGTNTWKERTAETNSPAIFFRPVAAISGVPAE